MRPRNDPAIAESNPGRPISRRTLGQTLFSWIALGVFPGLHTTHPICRHLLGGEFADSFDEILPEEKYKPIFLASAQFAALDKIADAIVPGSHRARSAEFIDLLLSADSVDEQGKFSDSLAAFEAAAQRIFHQDVKSLTGEQLNGLLKAASDEQSSDFHHFENLKGWVVGAYYSSETGMRDLGWTPDRVFSAYPACSHAESHS